MTAPGRIGAALGAVLAAGAFDADAAKAEDAFVEVFREGCLAHLPDFAGSASAFENLGFTRRDGRFQRGGEGGGERGGEGPDMLAELYQRTVDAGGGCVLAFEVPEDVQVAEEVEGLVADLSGNDFDRRDAERGGSRVEAFSWTTDGWEVLVVVLPRMSGMQALNVTVAEAR
jgi:hypothetical protein